VTEKRWQMIVLSGLDAALILRVGFVNTVLVALLTMTLLWIWDTEVDG
jgi:hypothetical protein